MDDEARARLKKQSFDDWYRDEWAFVCLGVALGLGVFCWCASLGVPFWVCIIITTVWGGLLEAFIVPAIARVAYAIMRWFGWTPPIVPPDLKHLPTAKSIGSKNPTPVQSRAVSLKVATKTPEPPGVHLKPARPAPPPTVPPPVPPPVPISASSPPDAETRVAYWNYDDQQPEHVAGWWWLSSEQSTHAPQPEQPRLPTPEEHTPTPEQIANQTQNTAEYLAANELYDNAQPIAPAIDDQFGFDTAQEEPTTERVSISSQTEHKDIDDAISSLAESDDAAGIKPEPRVFRSELFDGSLFPEPSPKLPKRKRIARSPVTATPPDPTPATEGERAARTRYAPVRDPRLRGAAIHIHGRNCCVCGASFDETYGPELARGYIEIHHLKSIAGGERETNPATDLAPLCANCHRMADRLASESDWPPQTIDELRKALIPRAQ
jgi:hypothetical protein